MSIKYSVLITRNNNICKNFTLSLKRLSIQFTFLLLASNFLLPGLVQSIYTESEYCSEWIEIDLGEESENEAEENEEIFNDDFFHKSPEAYRNTSLISCISYPPCKLPHLYIDEINTPPPELS